MKLFKLKPAKQDYAKSMLPQTRRAVFFDVIHLQWKSLLLLGLIGLLFYSPLLLSSVVKDVFLTNLYASLETATDVEKTEAGRSLVYLDVLRSFVNILLLAVFSVAAAGIMRVLRQYAWGENVHMSTDFARGIRDNFAATAAIFALGGLIYSLCLMLFYNASADTGIFSGAVTMLPIAISLLVVLPVFAISLVMIPIYRNRLWQTLKNAFVVYSRSLLKVLGTLLCALGIWIPALIPNFYCHLFGSIAAVLLTPFALLGWTLFCYTQFDKHINPLIAPELIGKGIRWEES